MIDCDWITVGNPGPCVIVVKSERLKHSRLLACLTIPPEGIMGCLLRIPLWEIGQFIDGVPISAICNQSFETICGPQICPKSPTAAWAHLNNHSTFQPRQQCRNTCIHDYVIYDCIYMLYGQWIWNKFYLPWNVSPICQLQLLDVACNFLFITSTSCRFFCCFRTLDFRLDFLGPRNSKFSPKYPVRTSLKDSCWPRSGKFVKGSFHSATEAEPQKD